MERVFKKKNLNELRPPIDRFVAPRHSFPELRRRLLWVGPELTEDIWNPKYLQKKIYTNYLNKAFGLEPHRDCRADPQPEASLTWPCAPRKRRFLSSADSILDLPAYSTAEFPDLLDWSNDNILVAAVGSAYHQWSWGTQGVRSVGFARLPIQCCKFDPRGELLILGTENNVVEIHNHQLTKRLSTNFCKCLTKYDKCCSITTVDWSPTGNSFITGCSRGVVISYDRKGIIVGWNRVARGVMLAVRVSPNARYVAAAALDADHVVLLDWPGLQTISTLNSDHWHIRAVTWHPWRSALLGIGATCNTQAYIGLWDAPSTKVRDKSISGTYYSLDAMLFSHRTGELALCLYNTDPAASYQKPGGHLVVLSNMDRVVDEWGEERPGGLNRVRKIVFSPDGNKLATATEDEDLIIWNFLPEDKIKKKTNSRRFCAMPVYLDKAMDGCSLR